jgi:hypothetical protein
MNQLFQQRLSLIATKCKILESSKPLRFPLRRTTLPSSGVYLFSEAGVHLYVGRSDNIRGRLGLHSRACSAYGQATFATCLAKEVSGLVANYQIRRIHPTHFGNQQAFRDAFVAAKTRIRAMEIRVVEEADPVSQALLEIYAAVVLSTKYNDFSNH